MERWRQGGTVWLVMAVFPSSDCDCAHYCPFTFHQQASWPCAVSTTNSLALREEGGKEGGRKSEVCKGLRHPGSKIQREV